MFYMLKIRDSLTTLNIVANQESQLIFQEPAITIVSLITPVYRVRNFASAPEESISEISLHLRNSDERFEINESPLISRSLRKRSLDFHPEFRGPRVAAITPDAFYKLVSRNSPLVGVIEVAIQPSSFERIFKLAQNSLTKVAGQSREIQSFRISPWPRVVRTRFARSFCRPCVSIYANDGEIAHTNGEKSVSRALFRWIKSSEQRACVLEMYRANRWRIAPCSIARLSNNEMVSNYAR